MENIETFGFSLWKEETHTLKSWTSMLYKTTPNSLGALFWRRLFLTYERKRVHSQNIFEVNICPRVKFQYKTSYLII